jgi:hypothetical protein
MALQTIEGAGFWFPAFERIPINMSASTYVLDAGSEMAALIFCAPKAGDLDRFDFNVVTATNTPDIRASFQGVSATTGLPDGTVLGATNNALLAYAGLTTGWKDSNFGEVAAVTRGQLISAVIDNPGFAATDVAALSRISSLGSPVSNFPYGISAASTKEAAHAPAFAIHYTDGYVFIPGLLGCNTITTVAYKQDTATADEWGMAFSLPFPCKLNAVAIWMAAAAGADFNVVVYDSDGTTVLATIAHDGDVVAATTQGWYSFFIQSELTLAANTTYRVTVQPSQTAANVTMTYCTFNSAALMQGCIEGGDNLYMTSQVDVGGTWTNYQSSGFRRPFIKLHVSAVSDGLGGGSQRVYGG